MREKICKQFGIVFGFMFSAGLIILQAGCASYRITSQSYEKKVARKPSIAARAPAIDFGLDWPLPGGHISSYFGARKRDFHDGIDIKASAGTPIYSAGDGKVIYCGSRVRGYGNLIIVRHSRDFATVYAHNRKNLIKTGDLVRKGQILGLVGSTGKATGPHLHFEIRYRELPVDPLEYLPQKSELAVR